MSWLDEEKYTRWLALVRVRGLGCAKCKRLVEHFGDPERLFSASEEELAEVGGLERGVVRGLLRFSDWDEIRKELDRVLEAGARIVCFTDSGYPARLRTIADPPPFLYVKGELREEDDRAVAVVGSRSASDYGVRMTQEICRGLASLGFTVVSGMARGIDGQAHEAALQAKGRTLAVLGSGVDVVYPPEHEDLYRRVTEEGAVVSELSMATPPFSYHFPSRNRLISGLSLGVVVVEATEKSGSLITAGLALEQGREVFAVPGQAGVSRSRGTNRLIRQGAKLVESVEDVVEEIAPQLLTRTGVALKGRSLPPDLTVEAKKIVELVLEAPLQIDQVIEASGIPAPKVSEILLDLELRGLLTQLPGKRFKAN